MKIATLDWRRSARIGLTEAVLCDSKHSSHIAEILKEARDRSLLLTRLSSEQRDELDFSLDYCPLSRTAFYGAVAPPATDGAVIVCAGTSDLPVALEAQRTLAFSGYRSKLIADVGVAGLWRVLERLDEIRAHDVVIAVAGMEGALFSVLGGLVARPLIAVPSSVGYGVAHGGQAALASALASCASGIVAVNIDNGFGAACAAIRFLQPAVSESLGGRK